MKRKEQREKAEAMKNPERVKAHIDELKSGKNLSRARKDEINRLRGYIADAESAAAKEKATRFVTLNPICVFTFFRKETIDKGYADSMSYTTSSPETSLPPPQFAQRVFLFPPPPPPDEPYPDSLPSILTKEDDILSEQDLKQPVSSVQTDQNAGNRNPEMSQTFDSEGEEEEAEEENETYGLRELEVIPPQTQPQN